MFSSDSHVGKAPTKLKHANGTQFQCLKRELKSRSGEGRDLDLAPSLCPRFSTLLYLFISVNDSGGSTNCCSFLKTEKNQPRRIKDGMARALVSPLFLQQDKQRKSGVREFFFKIYSILLLGLSFIILERMAFTALHCAKHLLTQKQPSAGHLQRRLYGNF